MAGGFAAIPAPPSDLPQPSGTRQSKPSETAIRGGVRRLRKGLFPIKDFLFSLGPRLNRSRSGVPVIWPARAGGIDREVLVAIYPIFFAVRPAEPKFIDSATWQIHPPLKGNKYDERL